MTFIYLDTETLGLDMDQDIWEIAYAVDDGPILSSVVTHNIENASSIAMAVNNYVDRAIAEGFDNQGLDREIESGDRFESDLWNVMHALRGFTLVGANPAFDAYRIAHRWSMHHSSAPWHYRMIDVSVLAMGVLGHSKPRGLHDICAELEKRGHWIAAPDHSAAGDVQATRDVHKALMLERGISE